MRERKEKKEKGREIKEGEKKEKEEVLPKLEEFRKNINNSVLFVVEY